MDILIGARRNGTNQKLGFPYTGSIDEVEIYNRALSASEVSALYQP